MTLIQCLYCGEHRPHSDEHILQKGLGGNLTFKDVCRPCNSSFSIIDQALTDYSVVALSRLVETPTTKPVARAASELIYDPDHELWKEVRVGNRLAVELLPQLHYRKGQALFAGNTIEGLHDLIHAVEHAIESGHLKGRKIRVDAGCITPRIAMRRPGQLIVRAPSLAVGEDFLEKLATHWAEFRAALDAEPRTGTVVNPKFQAHLRLDVNGTYRAVAKTVFNYLAYRRGVPYARGSRFDEIRGYIRGNNLVFPEPDGEAFAVDARFVTFAGYGKANLMATETHSIVITNVDDQLCGVLTLYAKHTFIVVLAPAERDFFPLVHEFSLDGSWNREIPLAEMVERRRAAMAAEVDDDAD